MNIEKAFNSKFLVVVLPLLFRIGTHKDHNNFHILDNAYRCVLASFSNQTATEWCFTNIAFKILDDRNFYNQ